MNTKKSMRFLYAALGAALMLAGCNLFGKDTDDTPFVPAPSTPTLTGTVLTGVVPPPPPYPIPSRRTVLTWSRPNKEYDVIDNNAELAAKFYAHGTVTVNTTEGQISIAPSHLKALTFRTDGEDTSLTAFSDNWLPGSAWGDYYGFNRRQSFGGPLILPKGITSIGDGFMVDQRDFRGPLTLPHTLTSIGHSFMANCILFNGALDIWNATFVGGSFLYHCSSYTSTIDIHETLYSNFQSSDDTLATYDKSDPMYVAGVRIAGRDAAFFLQKFPNIPNYRKLIAG